MIVTFRDRGTEDIYNSVDSRYARRTCPPELWTAARDVLDQLNAARGAQDLRYPRGLRLKKLRGDRRGRWSVRINDQYRVSFVWTDNGVSEVTIEDH